MTDLEIVLKEWPRLANGFGTTLLLFGISAVGAFLLGALMVGTAQIPQQDRAHRSPLLCRRHAHAAVPDLRLSSVLRSSDVRGEARCLDCRTTGIDGLSLCLCRRDSPWRLGPASRLARPRVPRHTATMDSG